MIPPQVQAFFDPATFTVTYVVADPDSGGAVIIDPVLDFDPASGRTSTRSADALVEYVQTAELQIEWILETHVHADHLTAAPYLRGRIGGRIGIGRQVTDVQKSFKDVFNMADLAVDGRQFDALLDDGDRFELGSIPGSVIGTPGHTPACLTYVVGDAAFVGDTLFMPDYGTARTDFPGGDAGMLYDSIRKILSLPEETRLFMCHDYKAPGRDEFAWETTVLEQKRHNIHISDGVSREAFVELREKRDAQLGAPKLMLPSIQVNVRAGHLPEPESNGIRYLKLPIDTL